MTRTQTREALAETWRFNCVGDLVALREVKLIEAVRALEARSPNPPGSFGYREAPQPRSS
jgi:hypothetical protein